MKGDIIFIVVPEDESLLGLEACKNNLHARIVWPKGFNPLIVVGLKEKMKPIWKNIGMWGVTSMDSWTLKSNY